MNKVDPLIKDIGILFFDNRILEIDDNEKKKAGYDVEKIKKNLLADLVPGKKYNQHLSGIGISEDDFLETLNFCKLSLQRANSEEDPDRCITFFLYKEYLILYKDYWFLKPAIYLSRSSIEQVIKSSPHFSEFLTDPLSCSSYFSFLTEQDLNYDYFLLSASVKSELITYFNGSCHQMNEVNLEEVSVIIKKWR
jgi:hypothetical protein